MSAEVSIDIDAPAEQVWQTLVEVESWPQWTQSVSSVERLDDGPPQIGSRTRIKQPKMAPIVWEVTAMDPGHAFTWVGRAPGVTTTASHELAGIGAGRTRLTLTVDHHGPLAGLVTRLTGRRTRGYLQMEAAGMKARSESTAM